MTSSLLHSKAHAAAFTHRRSSPLLRPRIAQPSTTLQIASRRQRTCKALEIDWTAPDTLIGLAGIASHFCTGPWGFLCNSKAVKISAQLVVMICKHQARLPVILELMTSRPTFKPWGGPLPSRCCLRSCSWHRRPNILHQVLLYIWAARRCIPFNAKTVWLEDISSLCSL